MIVSAHSAPRKSGKSTYAKRLADSLNCTYIDGKVSIPNLRDLPEVVIDEYCYYHPLTQQSMVYSPCRVHLVGDLVPETMHPTLRNCLQTHFPEVFL